MAGLKNTMAELMAGGKNEWRQNWRLKEKALDFEGNSLAIKNLQIRSQKLNRSHIHGSK